MEIQLLVASHDTCHPLGGHSKGQALAFKCNSSNSDGEPGQDTAAGADAAFQRSFQLALLFHAQLFMRPIALDDIAPASHPADQSNDLHVIAMDKYHS